MSANIRELLINHGCSSQRDAAGVTSFVRLGAHMCVRACANDTRHNLIFKHGFDTSHCLERKKTFLSFAYLQPQASSCKSCAAAVVALVASLSHKESFHKHL